MYEKKSCEDLLTLSFISAVAVLCRKLSSCPAFPQTPSLIDYKKKKKIVSKSGISGEGRNTLNFLKYKK